MTEKGVSVTVNNNNNSGSGNVGQITKARTNIQNRPEIPLPNPTTTALLQAYLTLNNLTRTSGDNRVPNTTVAVSHSAATKSLSDARPVAVNNKYDFCVKVINPDKKSEFSTYVQRDVTRENMNTPDNLRKELNKQFGDKLISSKLDFLVGYMKSGAKVSIRTSADLDDIWRGVTKGDLLTLWCHGISNESSSSSESDTEVKSVHKHKRRKLTAFEEKNKRVNKIVTSLREKHSERFTSIQYRLWAEMLDVGSHYMK